MNSAISAILTSLAAGTPKIYLRSITGATTRPIPPITGSGSGFPPMPCTTIMQQIDQMFDLLVAQINASGLPQL